MEPVDRRLILAGAGLAGVAALSRIARAGPLDPPQGPISPTGKTLQQIHDRIARGGVPATPEPRLPIQGQAGSAAAQYMIDQPGAYYLAGNISQVSGLVCIDIQCDGVDIDGGGFAFIGSSGSPPSSCIHASGRKDIEIYDCSFRGWQGCCCDCDDCDDVYVSDCLFQGCFSPANPATGESGAVVRCRHRCEVDDVCVSACNGCTVKTGNSSHVFDLAVVDSIGLAVRCGDGCCVEEVSVQNANIGAVLNGNVIVGSLCRVTECDFRNCNGLAVSTGPSCVVDGCECRGCTGGFCVCADGCCVMDCAVADLDGDGIVCSSRCSVEDCDFRQVTRAAVSAGFACVIECCEVTGGGLGCSGCVAIRCMDGSCVCDCTVVGNSGPGVVCAGRCSVSECDLRQCADVCVSVGAGSVVECCECTDCDGDGVQCGDGSCIEDCLFVNCRYILRSGSTGAASSVTMSDNRSVLCWGANLGTECVCCGNELNTSQGPAVIVSGARCLVEDNQCSGVGPGGGCIDILPGGDGTLIESNHIVPTGNPGQTPVAVNVTPGVTGCHVICNTARGGYNIPSLNSYGPVVNVAGVGNIGAIPEAAHPWANFSH